MDEFAAQHDFLINIGEDKGRKVVDIVAQEQPQVIVELGGYVGYSAVMLADQMRRNPGSSAGVHLWSLESDPTFAQIAAEVVAMAGLSEAVTIVTGPADESLRKLQADGTLTGIDLLFLDHVEDLYVQDVRVCEELGLLRAGSCIVADNVVRPGAPKYREYVRAHPRLQTRAVKGLIIPGDFEVCAHRSTESRWEVWPADVDKPQDELDVSKFVR